MSTILYKSIARQSFWHETMHWLKNSNPELFNRFVKAAGITDEQRQAYLERTGRTDLTDDAAIDEEIICDQMEDVASRSGLLQSIASKNRGLIERVVAWLQDTFKKFCDFFRNPQGGLTTKQSQALADEFGRIANQLVDPNGEKIFRYNRSTHTVELADGRSLEYLKNPPREVMMLEAKYSFAGRKAKTANLETLKQAKKMDERGADRDRIYQLTGWFKGKDGKWRFEIPDNRSQMNIKKLIERGNFGKETPLEQIYDNPELFAAYPKLRQVITKAVDPTDTGLEADLVRGAEAAVYGKTIFFNMDSIFDDMDECQKTLVHEIQHMIQGYEKFSSGGNYGQVKDELNRNADMILHAVDNIPDGKRYFDAILAVKKAVKRGNKQAEAKACKEMTQAKQNLSPKDRKDIETFADRYDEIKSTKTGTKSAKEAAYYRLGGEQEARHVEERLDNRDGTPVAHNDDALIVFGGKTYPLHKKNASENGEGELVEGSIPRTAATADGTTDNAVKKITADSDNKGGVSPNANVETNSPSGSISQGRRGDNTKYSIGNDNTSESLTQKIKGKLASIFSREVPTQRRNKRITQALSKLTGCRVAFGHMNGDETIIDDFHKVIRSPHAYEWKNILPKIGGKIAQSLKLTPSEAMNNYVADWLIDGALNNTSVGGERAVARITVKEILEYGHRLYTIEFQELNKPVELKNHAADDSSTGSKGSTLKTRQDSTTVAEEPSIKNISQTERGDNTKYSIGNDDSEESITQKIKGKLASIFSREVPATPFPISTIS